MYVIKLDGQYFEQSVDGKVAITPCQYEAVKMLRPEAVVALAWAKTASRQDGQRSDRIRLVRLRPKR
jgi:hypothetical protein